MGITKVYISEVPPIVLRNPGKDGTSGTSGLDGTFFGTSGTSGLDGTYFGSSGTSGITGAAGPIGTNGTSGIDGAVGPKGEKGELGADVIISETAPDIALDGKLWFNSTDGVLYIEYTDENGTYWIPSNDLVGDDGTSGINGTDGLNGNDGTDGISGTSGTSGLTGSSGSSGTSATSGINGSSGTDGSSGISGTDGTSAEYAAVYIANDAPTTGTNGKFWFNNNEGTLYIQYEDTNGTNWIPVNDLVGADGTNGTSGTSANLSGYVILQQVGESLNFIDDTAAEAGGVPINGLYRNGNIIQIRII